MFDFNRFKDLVMGGLLRAEPTWAAYHAENRPWQFTAANLTVPLIVGTMVVAGVLAMLMGGSMHFPSFGVWLLLLILSFVQFAIAVGIFTYFAGTMGGTRDYNRGVAALSFAAIPGQIGNALGPLPWIGWLIAIGLAILSLVYLYRILPLYLEVPDSKRVAHFIVSLLLTAVASFILSSTIGVGAYMKSDVAEIGARSGGDDSGSSRGGGFLGEVQRNAAIYDAAMADRYDPPSNGRLKKSQVEEYIRVMTRSKEMQDDYAAKMEALSDEMENKKEASLSDLMKIYRGAGGALTATNASMQIVKTAGGNWAEHVWVEEQLRLAKLQPDANEAAAKNRKLYDEFSETLDAVMPY